MPPEQEPADGLESAFADLITGDQTPATETSTEPNPFTDGFVESPEPEPEQTSTETEPKPDDDGFPEDPPSPTSDKAGNVWKGIKSELKKTREELRTERDERQKLLDAKEVELTELREQASRVPDLQQKATLVEEAEKKLAIYHVEQSSEYLEAITKPLDAIGANAEIIAKTTGVRLAEIEDAITEPDPVKRRELLKAVVAEMDDVDKNDVIQMSKDAQSIFAKREAMRSQAHEARKELEKLNRENETKTQAEARKTFESAVETGVVELKKRIPFVEMVKGETADGMFSDLLTKSKSINFDAATPATKAFSAAAGVLLPRMVKQVDFLQKENAELKARIAKDNSSLPSVVPNPETTPSIVKDVDFQNFLG